MYQQMYAHAIEGVDTRMSYAPASSCSNPDLGTGGMCITADEWLVRPLVIEGVSASPGGVGGASGLLEGLT